MPHIGVKVVRRVFGTIGKVLFAGFLLGIPATFAYLNWVGLDEGIRSQVAATLSTSTRRVTFERLTFNLFEGFVARDVTVTMPETTGRRVAEISRISISFNLAALVDRRIQVDSLALEGADLQIPFAEDGVEPNSIHLENVQARMLATDDAIEVPDATFVWKNIRFKLNGTIRHPESLRLLEREERTPEEIAERVGQIRAILNEFDQVNFGPGESEVQLSALVDLDDIQALKVPKLSVQFGEFEMRGLNFHSLSASAAYSAGIVSVVNMDLAGSSADLSAHGTWNPTSGSGFVRFSGGADPQAFYPLMAPETLPPIAEELHFDQMPRVEGTLTGDAEHGFKATGRLAVAEFTIKELKGKSLTADFAWEPGQWFVQGAKIALQTGQVDADVLSTDRLLRIRLESDVNPKEIESLTGPNERKILDVLEFRDNPKASIEMQGNAANLKELAGNGTLELGRTAMRGSWIDFATCKLRFENQAVYYEDISLGKGAQRASGGFVYDFGRREVRLEDVTCNLMPVDVLMWIDPRIAKTVEPYKFRGFPTVNAHGLVHMKNPEENSLSIQVDAPGGLDYDLINRTLPIGATQGEVDLTGQTVKARIPKAELFGGNVDVFATVSVNPKDPKFGADVKATNIDFPSLTELYFKYSRSKGVMDGAYSFNALLHDPGSMVGEGSINVRNGHVMNIPLFGPLSEILSAIIPGIGHESAKLASADFKIANQKVSTEDLKIEGDGFLMFGDGTIAYPSGQLDLTVRINAQGLPGVVLFPVSKLFEYHSSGTMSDPQWRPKVIPKEFFDILGEPARVLNSIVSPEPENSAAPASTPLTPTPPDRPPRTGPRRSGR